MQISARPNTRYRSDALQRRDPRFGHQVEFIDDEKLLKSVKDIARRCEAARSQT